MDPTAKWSARHPNGKPHPTRHCLYIRMLYLSRCVYVCVIILKKKKKKQSLESRLGRCIIQHLTSLASVWIASFLSLPFYYQLFFLPLLFDEFKSYWCQRAVKCEKLFFFDFCCCCVWNSMANAKFFLQSLTRTLTTLSMASAIERFLRPSATPIGSETTWPSNSAYSATCVKMRRRPDFSCARHSCCRITWWRYDGCRAPPQPRE